MGKSFQIYCSYDFNYSDKPYPALKPGQHTFDREYYKFVNNEKPDGQTVLSNFNRFKTEYEKQIDETVKVGDYEVPAKSKNNMSKLSCFGK